MSDGATPASSDGRSVGSKTRRGRIALGVVVLAVLAVAGVALFTGDDAAAPTTAPAELAFTVAGIDDGGTIAVEFTCDGENRPPTVVVDAVPDGTEQLALVVDDPTAEQFVHWIVYGIAVGATEFTDGDDTMTYGVNDAGDDGWFGPCPPAGDGPHDYVFTMFALTEAVELPPGLDGRELADTIADVTSADGSITADYERAGD